MLELHMHFGFGRIQLRCFLSVQCLYRERASEFSRKNKQVVNNDVCEGNTYENKPCYN